MLQVKVIKGHYGVPIRFNITRAGVDVPLTTDSYTAIVWKVWRKGESAALWSITGSIIEDGIADFTPADTHFDEVGTFFGELEWSKTGVVDGSKKMEVEVAESN